MHFRPSNSIFQDSESLNVNKPATEDRDRNNSWLDPEELPFTQEEVFQAAALWTDPATARQFAHDLAQCARDSIDARMAQQADWPATPPFPFGHEPGQLRVCGYTLPEWFWPTLSVMSPACAVRVNEGMSLFWRYRYTVEVGRARQQAAEHAGLVPTRKQTLERLQAMKAARNLVETPNVAIGGTPTALPELTDEMRHAASELVEGERRAWLALAAEAAIRLKKRSIDNSGAQDGSI